MKPTVGRIVHYQSYGSPGGEFLSEPRAAVITEVVVKADVEKTPTAYMDERNYAVSLCVLNPSGMFFNRDVPFSTDAKPGSWRWPPRE
jgi:hypothetical protein